MYRRGQRPWVRKVRITLMPNVPYKNATSSPVPNTPDKMDKNSNKKNMKKNTRMPTGG